MKMFELEIKKDYSERIRYNVPNMPVYISRNELKTLAGTSVECHWHDEIELLLLISGKLRYNVNGEHIELTSGDILFVNSKQLHYGYSTEDSVCEYICAMFHAKLLCTNKYMEQTFINPVLNGNVPYLHFTKDTPATSELYNGISDLWNAFAANDENCALEIHSLFYKIWATFYRNRDLANDNTSKKAEKQSEYNENLEALKEMVGFIHTNFTEKLSLNDISSAGTVCRSRCCNIFKEFLNQTPIGYLTSYRLSKSVLLLQNTEESIAEIALSTGFSGVSYFCETFRKHYSCSPSKFREDSQ